MLEHWINTAKADGAVWLDEVCRGCAQMCYSSPAVLEITLFNEKKRAFTRFFPSCEGEEQLDFVRDYLCALVFNMLSAIGGSKLTIYYDYSNTALASIIAQLDKIFQVTAPVRSGYGKAVSEANRICAYLGLPPFHFEQRNYAQSNIPSADNIRRVSGGIAASLCETAQKALRGVHCGIDVGGTDIKLALAVNGSLAAVREYDWNPAEYATAEEIIAPILRLTRLMRVCAAQYLHNGQLDAYVEAALDKNADDSFVDNVIESVEAQLGERINVLNSIGLSFPDVVIRDAIVGGETPKTLGLHRNTAIDYEQEFAKITHLKTVLEALCREAGHVRVTNDGNIAAYTAAMELAHSGDSRVIERGVFAHSLGTDLGTGWLDSDGTIPELTLELYDNIVDLGSWPSRNMPADDLRCVRNENSGLAGARRYMGQAAVFRMACAAAPELLNGFTETRDGVLGIRSHPEDMRKPCLEHIMLQAEQGNTAAEDIFRQIGRNLAHISREAAFLLSPDTNARFIFGRFVKRPRVFELICEGFNELEPNMQLIPADNDLAYTPLMRALAAHPDVTVAQFGQAIGAVYYGVSR